MSCLPLDPEDPPPEDSSTSQTRRGLLAGVGSVGVGATAASALWSAPAWVGIGLFALALSLLAMAGMILFGRRDVPKKRLIEIIKAMR
jgi:hypothetical protein